MDIAIIGAGNVGGALAKNWADRGHHISIGAKDPSSEKMNSLREVNGIEINTIQEAAQKAAVILIALPISAVVAVAKSLPDLSGKVIIDATNSVFGRPDPYQNAFEAFQDLTKAEVVKGFNTTGFENMENPHYGDVAIDMFTAGSSTKGKEIVKTLSSDAGFVECYDFGGDDKVPLIEQFAMAWINLAIVQKEGRDIAFKVLRR